DIVLVVYGLNICFIHERDMRNCPKHDGGKGMWKSSMKWMFLIIGTTIGAGLHLEENYGSFLVMKVDWPCYCLSYFLSSIVVLLWKLVLINNQHNIVRYCVQLLEKS